MKYKLLLLALSISLENQYYEAPGAGHEFQILGKSLYGFAQLLFKN